MDVIHRWNQMVSVLHSKAQTGDSSTAKWLVGCGNEANRTARQFGRPISTVISTRMSNLSERIAPFAPAYQSHPSNVGPEYDA